MPSRLTAALCLCAVLAGPVLAAGKKAETPAAPPMVPLSQMALPIVADGRVVNYVFLSVSVVLSPKGDAAKVRAKEAVIRDAVVREGHRQPFTLKTDYMVVDEARLEASVMKAAAAAVGGGQVVGVRVMRQTPQRRLSVPRPAGA